MERTKGQTPSVSVGLVSSPAPTRHTLVLRLELLEVSSYLKCFSFPVSSFPNFIQPPRPTFSPFYSSKFLTRFLVTCLSEVRNRLASFQWGTVLGNLQLFLTSKDHFVISPVRNAIQFNTLLRSVYYVQGTRLENGRLLFRYGVMERAGGLESVLDLNICHLLAV